MPVSRREFIKRGAAAGLAAGAPTATLPLQTPWVRRSTAVEPVVISSMNGNWYKNGGKQTCVELAYEQMTRGGDVLDALIAGVNITELDPEEDSVGYGGLPNAEGVVQLDSCCMHGPEAPGRRRGLHRRGAHALEGGPRSDGPDRPSPAGRRRARRTSPGRSASASRRTSTPRTPAPPGWNGSAAPTPSTTWTPNAAPSATAR